MTAFETSNRRVDPVEMSRAGVGQKMHNQLASLQQQVEEGGLFAQLGEAKDRFQKTVVDNMGGNLPNILNAIEKGKAMNFNVPKWLEAFLVYVAGLGETKAKVAEKVFGKVFTVEETDKKMMNDIDKEAQKRYPNDRMALTKFLTDVKNVSGNMAISTINDLNNAVKNYVVKVPFVAPVTPPATTVAAAPATAPAATPAAAPATTTTTAPAATTTQTPPKTA